MDDVIHFMSRIISLLNIVDLIMIVITVSSVRVRGHVLSIHTETVALVFLCLGYNRFDYSVRKFLCVVAENVC